jgi:hypothetical protein
VISVRYDEESGSSVVEQQTPELSDLMATASGAEVYEEAGAGD